jgi:hypothetical protein
MSDDYYDVVIDVLTKHRDKLHEMVKHNLMSEFMTLGIMDDIRLEQIDKINECIKLWRERNELSTKPRIK